MSYYRMLEVTKARWEGRYVPTVADLLIGRMAEEDDPIAYLRSIKSPMWLRYVAEEILKRV